MKNQFNEALEKGEQIYERLKEVLDDFWNWECPLLMKSKHSREEIRREYCLKCSFNIPVPGLDTTEETIQELCGALIEIREGIIDAEKI